MWLQLQNKRTCQHHTNKQLKKNNQNINKQNENNQKMFKKQVVDKSNGDARIMMMQK
jgi:replication-associated recombination protein RarA